MALQPFQYVFKDGTYTDTINVTVSTPATNSSGNGPGYAVTSITGTFEGKQITAEVGVGGATQFNDQQDYYFDNTIFTSKISGGSILYDGEIGSSFGLDAEGIEFISNGTEYNVFYDAAGLNGIKGFQFESAATGALAALSLTSSNAPCYCAGTRIRTDRGEVPVDDLGIGDIIVTASGQYRPIRWIGRRSYAGRFLAANPDVHPVLFRAGSLGQGLPRRDLHVSPLHAMFLDGVLIPAWLLVNGHTIVRDGARPRVDYFHVELDSHDILLAEGAPSESFVDDNSRGLFHNAADWAASYPGGELLPTLYCARRVEDGFELEAIRQRLLMAIGQVASAA